MYLSINREINKLASLLKTLLQNTLTGLLLTVSDDIGGTSALNLAL
jgi:hypothetical protein